jgi:tRNA C32,U32 (ribose-2'-O)-methylase TrmJ
MTRASGLLSLAIFAATLSACNSEILQKQAEQIKQQELEIAQQRKDLEAMLASQKMQDQKQQDCNRAFRDYFEKAQVASAGSRTLP